MKPVAGHDRVLTMALVLSFLFHLSMVTLFRIVVYFPRPELAYYDLSIVESRGVSTFADTSGHALEAPSAEDALERLEAGSVQNDRWASLPPVTLPQLNFSELDLIRLNRTSLDSRSRYTNRFENESDDLWSRFGQKLSTVGELLTGSDTPSSQLVDEPIRMFVGHPAPGFEAYLEWMSAPYDRQLLVMAKVEALWGADAQALEAPLVLVLRVNQQGRVTFVQMPLEDEAGLLESSAASMFKLLFEPLDTSEETEHHATLMIQAEGYGE